MEYFIWTIFVMISFKTTVNLITLAFYPSQIKQQKETVIGLTLGVVMLAWAWAVLHP